ncbi:hypothetical protein [Ornithinibacillus contaminans]|uniref:hypothetical protein n=1 Tax=Ornithinibacillus contaminans TaxID=694055 RepID=UPI0012EDFBF4|nr:hypothetical protein [Ornithinibacillus contaminans]
MMNFELYRNLAEEKMKTLRKHADENRLYILTRQKQKHTDRKKTSSLFFKWIKQVG